MRKDFSECITHKGPAKEFAGPFLPDTVYGGYVDTVCNGMAPLDQFPRVLPVSFKGNVACRMPYGGRIEDDLCPFKSNAAGGFREPLVVTDKDRDAAKLRGNDLVGIPGIEISFLKKTRVLRDMDFVIRNIRCAVRVDDNRRIVKVPVRSLLVQRDNDDNLVLLCYP